MRNKKNTSIKIRRTWGNFCPIERVKGNKKRYNRAKIKQSDYKKFYKGVE